jgi:hypothetical protein
LITRILHQEQNKKGKVGLRRIVNNVVEVIEGSHLKDADLYRGDRFIAVRCRPFGLGQAEMSSTLCPIPASLTPAVWDKKDSGA